MTVQAEIYSEYDNTTIYRQTARPRRFIEDPKFDVFLNPSKREKQKETLKNLTLKFQQVFQSMDMQSSYPALFQVHYQSALVVNITLGTMCRSCGTLSTPASTFATGPRPTAIRSPQSSAAGGRGSM